MSIGCRMLVGKKITVLVDYGGYNYDIYKSSFELLLQSTCCIFEPQREKNSLRCFCLQV